MSKLQKILFVLRIVVLAVVKLCALVVTGVVWVITNMARTVHVFGVRYLVRCGVYIDATEAMSYSSVVQEPGRLVSVLVIGYADNETRAIAAQVARHSSELAKLCDCVDRQVQEAAEASDAEMQADAALEARTSGKLAEAVRETRKMEAAANEPPVQASPEAEAAPVGAPDGGYW